MWCGGVLVKNHRLTATNDGGHVIGEDHHRAKLSDHDCWLMCELRSEGLHYAEIARKFECSISQAFYICNGLRRAHTATGQR